MSVPVFPTVRKYYPGIDNPLFLGDITTSQDNIISAMKALTGCVSGDFYIVSGLEYVLGTPNVYTPGIIFFNGDFFYLDTNLTEGLYLTTNYVDVLSETFSDATARNIYINQVATATSSSSGSTPLFTGNMDQYRINNKYLQMKILAILNITNNLGTAANADLGTGIGEVLTADQTYTQAQVNALLMMRAPSTPGVVMEWIDWDGTFPSNFNGNGLGIVYPFYNSATGERWGLLNGVATAGGNTAPNLAGKTIIGQGTDASSQTYTAGSTYGSNQLTLLADNIPPLLTDDSFKATPGGSLSAYTTSNDALVRGPIGVNADSPTTPINTMQSSYTTYKIVRLT